MSRYRRATGAGLSFFTVVAYRRQPILCDEAIRNALRAAIETVRVAHPFVVNIIMYETGALSSVARVQ